VTQPTIGSNVESITHKNLAFEAWDLGGQVCENLTRGRALIVDCAFRGGFCACSCVCTPACAEIVGVGAGVGVHYAAGHTATELAIILHE
jgi:hypothetical protein